MRLQSLFVAALLLAGTALNGFGQNDWPTYGHDLAGTRYSTLKQIDTGNVARLTRAWTYHMSAATTSGADTRVEGNEVPPPAGGRGRGRGAGGAGRISEVSPLVVGGRMYLTTDYNRVV